MCRLPEEGGWPGRARRRASRLRPKERPNAAAHRRSLRARPRPWCSAVQLLLGVSLAGAFHAPLHRRRIVGALPSLAASAAGPRPETGSAAALNETSHIRFVSPLLDYGYRPAVEEFENGTLATKPLLLYLPGFDGTFLSPFLQFPELHTLFDVRCLTVGVEDRSTFEALVNRTLAFLEDCERLRDAPNDGGATNASAPTELGNASDSTDGGNPFLNFFGGGRKSDPPRRQPPRPLYIAGESFGGLLALEVTHRLLAGDPGAAPPPTGLRLRGLALINPATCFDRSRLAAEGPAVAALPAWLYPAGLLRLLPLFADPHSLPQLGLILAARALPSVIDTPAREAYLGRVALSLPRGVLPVLTQPALRWRLTAWLAAGGDAVARRLPALAPRLAGTPVLVVAGERDGTLPSIAEAERLAGLLPDVAVHVVEGAGHASTCGSRVDLAALFRARFPELRTSAARGWGRGASAAEARVAMKPAAAAGRGAYFGMEPRYDNATVGLNPLTYWNKKYYKKANQTLF